MSESTRRALRTAYQGLLTAIVVVPMLATFLAGTPVAAQAAIAVAVLAAIAKLINALEDQGLIPAWLKGSPDELP